MPDEVACHLTYAPTALKPRFYLVFFNTRWTLIEDIESTVPNSTTLSAKSSSVHLDLPSGGSEQARRVNCASTLPSIFVGAPQRGFSYIANSRPSVQYRFLIRHIVDLLTCNVFRISLSERPSLVMSSILARVKLLAGAIPFRRYCCNLASSPSFKVTR